MSVTFTSNIGLAKPSETELAKEWTRNSKLMEDNNTILIDKMDINISTYTPVVRAQTTNPNLGTGETKGEYIDFQGIIIGNAMFKFLDSGISAGVGEYGVSLPFPVDGSFHAVGSALNDIPQYSVIGEGHCYDASNINSSGSFAVDAVTISGVSYARMITEVYTVPTKTSRFITHDRIFVPVSGDGFTLNFWYKKA